MGKIRDRNFEGQNLSRVARGNSPPGSHRSVREPLDSYGSSHPIDLYNRLYFSQRFLPSLVDQILKPDEPTPSLHLHYRDFITTTSWSAPVPRIGTLMLVGSPLAFLPYHQDDRFPRSVQEPDSESRHLYAGGRPGSKQVSPELIPKLK